MMQHLWAFFGSATLGAIALALIALLGRLTGVWKRWDRHRDNREARLHQLDLLRAEQDEQFRQALLAQIREGDLKITAQRDLLDKEETIRHELRERLNNVKLALDVARQEREEQRQLKHDLAEGLGVALLVIQQYRDRSQARFDELNLPVMLKLGHDNQRRDEDAASPND